MALLHPELMLSPLGSCWQRSAQAASRSDRQRSPAPTGGTGPGSAAPRELSAIGKRWLLDELQELTGYHRKSLLRLLNRPEPMAAVEPGGSLPEPTQPHHRRRYGPQVVQALVPLWEASDRLCVKPAAGVVAAAGGAAQAPRASEPGAGGE